jgi:hypothetical protein
MTGPCPGQPFADIHGDEMGPRDTAATESRDPGQPDGKRRRGTCCEDVVDDVF